MSSIVKPAAVAVAAVAVMGSKFLKAMMDSGLVPERTRRIVIDMEVGGAIKIFYETFAGEEIESQPVLDAVLELGLHIKGTEIKS